MLILDNSAYALTDFNTTSVIVQCERMMIANATGCYFNTTSVIVQSDITDILPPKLEFQYNICYCSIWKTLEYIKEVFNFNTTSVIVQLGQIFRKGDRVIISIQHLLLFNMVVQIVLTILRLISIQHLLLFNPSPQEVIISV